MKFYRLVILSTFAVGCFAQNIFVYNPFTDKLDYGGPFFAPTTLANIPATCSVGQFIFITDATPGQNIYECTAPNTWTQQLNSGAAGANTALSNLASPSLNVDLLPNAAGSRALGSALKPFSSIFLGAGASQSVQLTGTFTGNRVVFIPDAASAIAQTISVVANNYLTGFSAATGAFTQARPTCANLSDSTAGCSAAIPLSEANGGTGANNTVGAAGHVLRSNATHYVDAALGFSDLGGSAALSQLASQANATFVANTSGGSAAPTAVALPTTVNALIKTSSANGTPSSGDVQDASNQLNSATAATQAVTYSGGQDASSSSALGGVTVRGANQTGTGGAGSAGGSATLQGGANAATNAASQAGSVEVVPGASTGATQGLQGLNIVGFQYIKGSGSTVWNLQCPAAVSMTVADCGASPNNWVGVAEVVGSNTVQMLSGGQVPINASAAVTMGHTVCAGSTAGKVTDSGGTSTCTNAQGATVGVVVGTSGAWTLPDGTTFTATTSLPLVQMNTAANINVAGGGSGTVSNCGTNGSVGYYSASGTTITCVGANLITSAAGSFSTFAGIVTAGIGNPAIVALSDVTAVNSNQNVTLATSPAASRYLLDYYADQNALTGGGSCTVSFTFNWTDATNARSLTTGPMTLGVAQVASGYLSGSTPIFVGSGNVTYTSTFNGSCGSATYDVHVGLTRTK